MRTLTFKTRQYAAYALLVLLTTVSVSAAYHRLNRDKVLFRQAEIRFARGEAAAAAALYEQAFAAGLQRPDAAAHLLAAYQASGMHGADPVMVERISRMAETPEALVSLADEYASRQQWDEAIAVLERHAAAWFNEPGVILRLADMYRNKGEAEKAERGYRLALTLTPRSLYARFQLAETLAWQKRYPEAESLLQSILTDYPEHRLTMITLARVMSWHGRFEEAIALYRRALGEAT